MLVIRITKKAHMSTVLCTANINPSRSRRHGKDESVVLYCLCVSRCVWQYNIINED